MPTDPGFTWKEDKDDDYDYDGARDTFTMPELNLCIGDYIKPQMGNNILFNRMYVTSDRAKVDSTSFSTGCHYHVPYQRRMEAWTTVLPMDARPTPMIIRLNVYVNDVPMQFQYQTLQKFEAGYSYDYKCTISLRDDQMYIATWEDVSWKTDVYPEK